MVTRVSCCPMVSTVLAPAGFISGNNMRLRVTDAGILLMGGALP